MGLSNYISNPIPHVRLIHRHNVEMFKMAPLAELSGSLGDLGTLLPLMTALVLTKSICLPSTLLFTGAANILTGVSFGIPLPVQPMKAIAAVAIARHFSQEETAAAGIVVAALIFLFSITGSINWINRVTPIPVIKGIQVGAGLSLCLSAGTSLLSPLSWTGPLWCDNLIWALLASLFLLSTLAYPKLPYALIVFAVGLFFSILTPTPHDQTQAHGPAIPILHPSFNDFWNATTTASLGQLPLTLLNSIIAVSALSADLLPSPPHPPTPSVTQIGLSVSAINLIGCWFGAMPACHGSGGLAAQHRFGARSGSSVIFLGTLKVVLGLIALSHPAGVTNILSGIPKSILGILVLAAGIELAKVGESVNTDARDLRIQSSRDESHQHRDIDGGVDETAWDGKEVRELDETERRERWMVMLVTVASLLTFRNDGVGFLAGLAWHWGIRGAKAVQRWREQRDVSGFYWRSVRHRGEEHTALLRHEESDAIA